MNTPTLTDLFSALDEHQDFSALRLLEIADMLTEGGAPWGEVWPWQWMAREGRHPGKQISGDMYVWWTDWAIVYGWSSKMQMHKDSVPVSDAPLVIGYHDTPSAAYLAAAAALNETYPDGKGLLTKG